MTNEQMKAALISAYPTSALWKKKVKNMPEDQVVAVYLRLKAQGRVN